MHLELFILVRKVIFIRTIMIMKDGEVVKEVKFCADPAITTQNKHRSPIYEMLIAAARLCIFDEVMILIGGTKVWTKQACKDLVWKKAWVANDARNELKLNSHKELNLFKLVYIKVTYSCWWQIADIRPDLVYLSETMIKLLSHASDLKYDNPLLKAGSRAHRLCNFAIQTARTM